jgi:hypothetical protein
MLSFQVHCFKFGIDGQVCFLYSVIMTRVYGMRVYLLYCTRWELQSVGSSKMYRSQGIRVQADQHPGVQNVDHCQSVGTEGIGL